MIMPDAFVGCNGGLADRVRMCEIHRQSTTAYMASSVSMNSRRSRECDALRTPHARPELSSASSDATRKPTFGPIFFDTTHRTSEVVASQANHSLYCARRGIRRTLPSRYRAPNRTDPISTRHSLACNHLFQRIQRG